MNGREYKPFENATSEHAAHWIFRKFCKHAFVAHRLDKNLFEKENNHLYITCNRCGEQYICNEFFNDKIQKVMNKEQIIDEVYETYNKEIIRQREIQKEEVNRLRSQGKRVKVSLIELLTKEEFINKCKTDPEFSEQWELKIEERVLSLEERRKLAKYDSEFVSPMTVESWDRNNIPTKLITLTYNNETIESYE